MTNRGKLFGFMLLAGVLFLAAASAAPTEEADVTSFAPSPEPEFEAPLSPQYSPLSSESESPAPVSPETGLESPSTLYPPDLSPSPAFETEPSFQSSPLDFHPVSSPAPEMEPADSDSSIPSISLPLPSVAPITGDDNDAELPYEPTPSSPPLSSDQSNGIADEESAENYSEQDGSVDSSSSDHQSKGGSGVVFGVVAGVCLVGLGGFVYLKRREDGIRRSKYDQYLELSKREGV